MKIQLFTISMLSLLIISCSDTDDLEINKINNTPPEEEVVINEPIGLYPASLLTDYSDVNKSTSWYRTNSSFDDLIDFDKINISGWGYEKVNQEYLPIQQYKEEKDSCCYYWFDEGGYLLTDLNGDGSKDLWANYIKSPWPRDANGLFVFNDNIGSSNIQFHSGLTQVRKVVLSDFQNDNVPEVMLFSSGVDKMPFPGDSLAFFNTQLKTYKFLSQDIGYFHGGATGDIDGDGLEDIVAYSGGSAVIPTHPTHYKNLGNENFQLMNSVFLNFTEEDNYYTVELFDIDNDGKLDLFLGRRGVLLIIPNENGTFNRSNGVNIQSDSSLEPMDIGFFDFDKDGDKEILVMNNLNIYKGYSLKIYDFTFENNSDVTTNYFKDTTYEGENSWMKWIRIFDYDKDGDLEIVGDGLFGHLYRGKVLWKESDGVFQREQVLTN